MIRSLVTIFASFASTALLVAVSAPPIAYI